MQKQRTSCSSISLETTRSGFAPLNSWTRPSAWSSAWPSPSLLTWWEQGILLHWDLATADAVFLLILWEKGVSAQLVYEVKFKVWCFIVGWEKSANDNQRVDETGKWSQTEQHKLTTQLWWLWEYFTSTSDLPMSSLHQMREHCAC